MTIRSAARVVPSYKKPRRPLDGPIAEQLRHLRFELKMTRKEIAEHYGMSLGTTKRWLASCHIVKPNATQIVMKDAKLFGKVTQTEIARRLGVSHTTVRKARRTLGFAAPQLGRPPRVSLEDILYGSIVEARTYADIAAHSGVTRQAINYRAIQAGLRVRLIQLEGV